MPLHTSSLRIPGLAVSIVLTLVLALVAQGLNVSAVEQAMIAAPPPIDNAITAPVQAEQAYGRPARLRIPSIKVDSLITGVGITPDGAMDMTKSLDDTMWYKPGPRPGERGSAVIAGHYVRGTQAVFNNLHKLRTGDKLYVEDENGVGASFVVRESRSYDPHADASEVFGSLDGKSHLNLVTCEGTWDAASQSYAKRLVVFADKE